MEIYGNSLLSSRTNEYLNSIIRKLVKFVCGDKNYRGPLAELIDLSNLTFKEKDELCDILQSYDKKFDFCIEKYRDDRLRYMYKDRYDVRENLIDWDYCMNLSKNV
jgi:5'-deoxynucleotidase YfbR-like HD superfamily hydrolase